MLQNKARKDKVHRVVSQQTMFKLKIFQSPAEFSNFGVISPEWLLDLLFWV